MTAKIIPAAVAARPVQRMRFAAVGFICLSPSSRWLPRRDYLLRRIVIGVRVAIRSDCPLGIDLHNREQWQADVAHALEQAVQCGLVGDRAMDDGGAVALVGEIESVKPGGPPRIEVPFQADLVPFGLMMAAGRCVWWAHIPP